MGQLVDGVIFELDDGLGVIALPGVGIVRDEGIASALDDAVRCDLRLLPTLGIELDAGEEGICHIPCHTAVVLGIPLLGQVLCRELEVGLDEVPGLGLGGVLLVLDEVYVLIEDHSSLVAVAVTLGKLEVKIRPEDACLCLVEGVRGSIKFGILAHRHQELVDPADLVVGRAPHVEQASGRHYPFGIEDIVVRISVVAAGGGSAILEGVRETLGNIAVELDAAELAIVVQHGVEAVDIKVHILGVGPHEDIGHLIGRGSLEIFCAGGAHECQGCNDHYSFHILTR